MAKYLPFLFTLLPTVSLTLYLLLSLSLRSSWLSLSTKFAYMGVERAKYREIGVHRERVIDRESDRECGRWIERGNLALIRIAVPP